MEVYPDKPNWCTLLKYLLFTLGMYDAWYFQEIDNTEYVLYIVKQRLCDQCVHNWQGRLEQSSRARFYKNISSFKLQPHLDALMFSNYRYAMSKLRMSSHRLHIETGRWSKPRTTPLNERTCINCNVIEDEFHFVLECKLFRDIRNRYIPIFYRNHPSMYKLITLIMKIKISLEI